MAKICLVLTGTTIEENLDIIKRNRDFINLVELRTDLLAESQLPLVVEFPELTDLPVILTCRKKCDGGNWNQSESLRLEKMIQWLDGAFSYIDLEMDLDDISSVLEKAKLKKICVIRSFHDFYTVPGDLYDRMIPGFRKGNHSII